MIPMIRRAPSLLTVLLTVVAAATAAEPRNVILFIGDGMGIGQVGTASQALGPLAIESAPITGLMRTTALVALVTDSAAAGTAMATGHKTSRGTLGQLPQGRVVRNLTEAAHAAGLSTGVVTTSGLADATPAAFTVHAANRYRFEPILNAMLQSGVEVQIGGDFLGYERIRADTAYLGALSGATSTVPEGTTVARAPDDLLSAPAPVVALFPPRLENTEQHGPPLAVTTRKALELLDTDADGFFVMIEHEATDQAGHTNDRQMVIDSIRELDRAVQVGLRYAEDHPNTLVLVTADHDTGGLAIVEGRADEARFDVQWATDEHTALWVPVFAFGAGSERFSGVFENTDLAERIGAFLQLEAFPDP